MATPVVDQERVSEIQDRLRSGRFEIDAASVADKLLRFEEDLD